jgi:hypothetical protein
MGMTLDYWSQVPESAPITLPTVILRNNIKFPCGSDCFTLRQILDDADIQEIEMQKVNDLQTIMRFIPDQSPCDLARLVRLPCYQVCIFSHLSQYCIQSSYL